MTRAASIMLQNLPIMLFGISLIFAYYARFYATPQTISYATNDIHSLFVFNQYKAHLLMKLYSPL